MDTCRICLRKSSSQKQLFVGRNNLARRINDLFNFDFQIIEVDSQPKNICFDCLTDLHHAFKFFENISFAQHQLSIQQEVIEIKLDKKIETEEESNYNYVIQPGTEENDEETDEQMLVEIVPVVSGDDKETDLPSDLVTLDEEFLIEESLSQQEEFAIEEIIQEYSDIEARITKTDQIFSCEKCGKLYDKRVSLTYHTKTKHTDFNEREFQCQVCPKRFAMKSDLTRHSRIHTNEKRYTCNECGKSFTDRSTHLKHQKVHTGVKPFTCELCTKSFSYKFVLDNHYLTHTGEKNFLCPECGKRFARKSKLKEHFLRIHKKKFTEDDEKRMMLEMVNEEKNDYLTEEFVLPVTEVTDALLETIVESV